MEYELRLQLIRKAIQPSQGPINKLASHLLTGVHHPKKWPEDERRRLSISPAFEPTHGDWNEICKYMLVMCPQATEEQVSCFITGLVLG
jgi:hypothetical protein